MNVVHKIYKLNKVKISQYELNPSNINQLINDYDDDR